MEDVEEDVSVYVEGLRSLKTLSDLQHELRTLECQVEKGCNETDQVCAMMEDCERELSKLEEERALLVERMATVDKDRQKLTELRQMLIDQCQSRLKAVPESRYQTMLDRVNSARTAVGFEAVMLEIPAVQSTRKVKLAVSKVSQSPSRSIKKSGRSQKHCPQCGQQVPRNATKCFLCDTSCRMYRNRRSKSSTKTVSSTKPLQEN